jgi:hypothetical protein
MLCPLKRAILREIKMLDLVMLFLATLVSSSLAVFLCRVVSGWHGFNYEVLGRTQDISMLNISPQQGYISLVRPVASQQGKTRVLKSASILTRPWGW